MTDNQDILEGSPVEVKAKEIVEFKVLDKLTKVLDTGFRFPGTKFRFGIDPVLGLFPGIGDVVTYCISAILLVAMARHGVSAKVAFKMFGNLLAEVTIGSIPIIGDIWDFFFKSNRNNYKLLQEYHLEGKHSGSVWWIIVLILFVIVALFALLVFGIIKFLSLVWGFIF